VPDHGRQLTGPDLRIGDREREAALTALGEHLTAGRLDLDEYGRRSALATHAERRGDLVALFADLPAPHPDLPGSHPDLPGPGADLPGPGADLPGRPAPVPADGLPPADAPVPVRAVPPPAPVPSGTSARLLATPAGSTAGQRAVAASLAVMWAVGVPLLFILGGGRLWWLIFVPIGVSVFAGQYYGDDWRGHGHGRRSGHGSGRRRRHR
jgi:hypothetical protein